VAAAAAAPAPARTLTSTHARAPTVTTANSQPDGTIAVAVAAATAAFEPARRGGDDAALYFFVVTLHSVLQRVSIPLRLVSKHLPMTYGGSREVKVLRNTTPPRGYVWFMRLRESGGALLLSHHLLHHLLYHLLRK
jgi:hypothetical protein